nr:hypothetical protein [Tanacetum cinerariifolium]
APGVVKPEIRGNVNFEIKSQFMRELKEETFSGNKNDDAYEHVERTLDIEVKPVEELTLTKIVHFMKKTRTLRKSSMESSDDHFLIIKEKGLDIV